MVKLLIVVWMSERKTTILNKISALRFHMRARNVQKMINKIKLITQGRYMHVVTIFTSDCSVTPHIGRWISNTQTGEWEVTNCGHFDRLASKLDKVQLGSNRSSPAYEGTQYH